MKRRRINLTRIKLPSKCVRYKYLMRSWKRNLKVTIERINLEND
jgi:hypothetical protein